MENSIDPRLCHAQPGQYVDSNALGLLTPTEDLFYRRHNKRLDEYDAVRSRIIWHQQLQYAATTPVAQPAPKQAHHANMYSQHPAYVSARTPQRLEGAQGTSSYGPQKSLAAIMISAPQYTSSYTMPKLDTAQNEQFSERQYTLSWKQPAVLMSPRSPAEAVIMPSLHHGLVSGRTHGAGPQPHLGRPVSFNRPNPFYLH